MQNQQEQQPVAGKLRPGRNSNRIRKVFNIFGILFFVFIVVTVVISIWAILHRTPKNPEPDNLTTILVTVIIPILGIVYAYLQVHLALNPPHVHHISPSLSTDTWQSSFLSSIPSSKGLNPTPPATTAGVIQQPRGIVRGLCKLLSQNGVTSVMLTGIAGVGKSTLAAFVYQFYQTHRSWPFFLQRLFTAPPLWFEVDASNTFDDLAKSIFKNIDRPFPIDFPGQTPDVKASMLISAMEQATRPRLIVLDQFDNWLEWKTGQALPDNLEVDAFLNVINNRRCRNKFLLTSRIRPKIRQRGTHINSQACAREFLFKRLEVGEAVQLLQVGEVEGTEVELQKIARHIDGHAGALVSLVSLLRDDEPSLDFHSTRCIEHWMRKVHHTIFRNLFLQFNYYEQELLYSFSVYRTPIPLQIALSPQMPGFDDTWHALDTLLKQHIFQKSNNSHYCLHPVVARCTQHYLYQINRQGLKLAHDQAGLYYQSLGWKPQGMRQRKEDIQYLLELIWHLCNAERKEEAQDLAQQENIRVDLLHWEDHLALLELQELLA